MNKFLLFLPLLLFAALPMAQGQRFYTKTAKASFYSSAPLENIEAFNYQGLAVMDTATLDIECSVLMKGFQFKKALMQQHFNENYVESHKYPKALFKGKLQPANHSFSRDAIFETEARGNLTLHGVTQPLVCKVKIQVNQGKISAKTQFNIKLSDYKIGIPALVKDNINNLVAVSFEVAEFQPFPTQ